MDAYVNAEIHQTICTIEFYHPQSNSLPSKMLRTLANEIHAAGINKNVTVIILRSKGEKAFCAGASFDELLQIQTEDDGLKFFSGFAEVINAIRKCPKFVLARIQGKCVGGGVGLAAAADYAFATTTADVKLSELAVGIGPFVIGPAAERKMGTAAFMQLSIDATKWRSADWAKRKGLFYETHDSPENLDEAIFNLSNTLAHTSPQAMAQLKKVFWQGTDNWDTLLHERAKISGQLILTDFAKNAINTFKSKA
jgi:methylglutaconyl-CoA hydratase